MTCVADTSWLFALVHKEDPHHGRSKAEARTLGRIFVPPVVLAETLGLIQYQTKGDQGPAVAALDAMRQAGIFALGVPEHDHDATVRIWKAHDMLSYVDAAAVAAARRLGVGLCTFDDDQAAAHRSGRP